MALRCRHNDSHAACCRFENPTVRTRYMAVRELLADYGHLGFHESLLELLSVAQMSRDRVGRHLATLTGIFDRATRAIKTPFPFATDISDAARPMTIDGTLEMIDRGYHREAMFWIAVTHSRCRKVILRDAPAEMTHTFRDGYRELVGDDESPLPQGNSAALCRDRADPSQTVADGGSHHCGKLRS